jgi:hypothetical protein
VTDINVTIAVLLRFAEKPFFSAEKIEKSSFDPLTTWSMATPVLL